VPHVAIIGAGVAGLGAAYRIKRAADAGADVSWTVLERDDRVGGKLWTDTGATDDLGQPLVVDGGSDSYLTMKPSIRRVAEMLGIDADITGTADENKGTYIVKDGKMLPLVDGMMMFAPTKIVPLATSGLYSWPGKIRMGLDLFIPKKRQPETGIEDESLESLVVRRLGRECLDRVAEPLVGGVNGSNPATMSVLATYPMLLEMEQEHGSLIKGFLAQRQKTAEMKKLAPKGTPARTMFSSFRQGLGYFTDQLALAVGTDSVRLGIGVDSISRDGETYTLTLSDGGTLLADAVIIATEAWAAAELLEPLAADAAAVVATIPSSSCATIVTVFDEDDVPFHKKWHGALSPAVEQRQVTGISLVSSKWAGRCPDGRVMFRCFVGGARDDDALRHTDDELIAAARRSYEELIGLKHDASLRYAKVFRFERGMPQYTVGHLERMATLSTLLSKERGLAVGGGPYHGVGVPNCLDSGEAAAAKVLADLNLPDAPAPEPTSRRGAPGSGGPGSAAPKSGGSR